MTADGTKLEKLFVEPRDAVYAISCHPYQPLIAVGSVCGMIKVWDYEKKVYLFSRAFEKGLGVQSLTYNPEGTRSHCHRGRALGCHQPIVPLPRLVHSYAIATVPSVSLPVFSVAFYFSFAYCCRAKPATDSPLE